MYINNYNKTIKGTKMKIEDEIIFATIKVENGQCLLVANLIEFNPIMRTRNN